MFRTLTPTLSILVALFLFIFFTNPQYKEIKGILKETVEYKEAAGNYAQFNASIQEKLSKKNSIKVADRERLDAFVPDEIESTRILVDIEGMAKKNGMLFGNISVDEASDIQPATHDSQPAENGSIENGALRSADISFDVIGTYDQFKSFLSSLESSLTLLEVIDISLATGESQFQQYAMTVRTYALPETNN